jgi:hypothetical protein
VAREMSGQGYPGPGLGRCIAFRAWSWKQCLAVLRASKVLGPVKVSLRPV